MKICRQRKGLAYGCSFFNVLNVLSAVAVLMRTVTDKMNWIVRIAALFCVQYATIAQSVERQSLQGHVPAAVSSLTTTGRLEANRELKIAIGLPLRNKAGLTNLLQKIYDPASPEYHHYLTPVQFADAFGPTESDYQAVKTFANAHGLDLTATHSNRTLLDVAGSVSKIEKAFHVTMRTYRHPHENREFYAPDVEPSLDLAAPILHISGLDNFLHPHPMSLRTTPQTGFSGLASASGSGPEGAYIGEDFRAAYAPGLTLTGAGQKIGLLEFDGYYPSDISNYDNVTGAPSIPLENVYLDEFSGNPGSNNVEVALDIEMAVGMAPGLSSVIIYEGEQPDDILNRMATDNLAKQLGASWSYPIDAVTEQIFQQFAAQGQSFFNASGDSDAWIGEIPAPCADPNITIVGGTTLTTSGPGGPWESETVWNWDIEYGPSHNGQGSGGGISTIYTIPPWQLGVSMTANNGSTSFRNIPDVALTADNIFVVADNGREESVGGTSCATQLWAAFAALVNEQAEANDIPPLGFINPAIYAIGLGVNNTNSFHDITTGNNTWSESPTLFYAVPGYDLCSGWGTPAGSNLVNLLAPDSLQILPSGNLASSGGVAGPLTPAWQGYTLTNIGTKAINWSVAGTVPWLSVSPSRGTLTPGGSAVNISVSLNAAASNLFLGTYDANIWFTNLTDGVVQGRAFTLAIIKPPVILDQPASQTVIGGTTVTFTAGVAGGLPLNYRWQVNGIDLAGEGRVSGSKGVLTDAQNIYGSVVATLTISNVTTSDNGAYALAASNTAGAVASASAILTVASSGPVIVQQPANQTVLVGSTVQLDVEVEGTTPFTFQWQQNGTNLTDGSGVSGSASPNLTITGASSASIGTYTVVVSNVLGTTFSTGAVLTVQVAVPGGQLVQNGGFETGSFSSWTETGNFSGATVNNSSSAVYSGDYGALLGAAGSLGYLSQSLPTVAGQSYLISLWLDSPDGISPNEFLVSWDGSILFDQVDLGAIGWTNLQFFAVATTTNTQLQIGFRDDGSFLGLDNVQVIPLVSADGPPIITTQPASQTDLQRGVATFSTVSSGQFPLFYQWQFDGANMVDATNATLVLTNLTSSQAGLYDVLVSNSLGWTSSSNALLTVLTGEQELITFDDLPYRFLPVPEGYSNLNWSNFYYLNGVVSRASGYFAGMTSVPKVAYNGNSSPAAISAAAPFVLFSANLTAAWNDNLQLEVQGYNGSALIYDNTYTLSASSPTLISFNYLGVTSVQFISSGGTPHAGYGGSGTEFVIDNVNAFVAAIPHLPPPLPITMLYSFDGFDGGNPSSGLVQGIDGNFYGTTEYGGTNGYGTVFSMSANGALTTLLSLDASNAYPYGALVQAADGNFYGTTQLGGTNDAGTVFSITVSGTFSTLASFNNAVTGGYPSTALVQGADGSFYGTTSSGGAFGVGTVFRMTTNGTLTTLVSFDSSNGADPYDALVPGADGNFYGTTFAGGTYGVGTVFKMTTNGALTTLVSFDGFNAYPYSSLALGADGNFYGTSEYGGTNGEGSAFSVTTNGAVSNLASFNYDVTGGYPIAALIQGDDGNFYGTASSGGTFGTTYYNGTYGGGTVFSMTTNGELTTLLSFSNTNGLFPQAGLVRGAYGYFYGTASFGGLGFNGFYDSGDGVVFRLGEAPTTTPPAIIAQPASQIAPINGTAFFSVNASGGTPLSYAWQRNGSPITGATQSSYTAANVQLTDSGGQFNCVISNAYGAATSSNATLTVSSGSGPLFAFHGPDGGYPWAALMQGTDGNFYGTTEYGGTYGNGIAFSMTTNGTFSTLASLDYYVTGGNPYAALIQGTDGNFYGTTTYGGLHDAGTVFRLTTNGTLTVLVSFNGPNGAEPYGALVQGSDGTFYGTTEVGGPYGYGTVFNITTNGAVATLVSFDYSHGAYPLSTLMLGADGILYGTTSYGGTNGYGAVFSLTTNGVLRTLFSFDNLNGAYLQAGLVQGADGNLYGMTTEGGTNGDGTLFKMTTNGALTTLFSFAGSNGANPEGGLVQGADGTFYGTTTEGGTYGNGTVFSLTHQWHGDQPFLL
jgi:uncharacterized repeat protein (TIGR03803 family)